MTSSSSSSSSPPHFRAKGIGKKNPDGTWLFRNVNIDLEHGVLTIAGPSGVGKSTLLKCLNQTITMDEGQVWLGDRTPDQWGIPLWRSRVMYIPQRTAIMEGTPLEFLDQVRRFNAHRKNKDTFHDPVQIGLDWGLRPDLWHKKWNTLSGGEMQRISLAIGCSFRPDILLLDEPTSALDEQSCDQVEKTLTQLNCIWVTHNPQQAKRVSSAGQLNMQGGDTSEERNLSDVVVDGQEQESEEEDEDEPRHRQQGKKFNGSQDNRDTSDDSKSRQSSQRSTASSGKTAHMNGHA